MDSRHRGDPDTLPWRVTYTNIMGEEKTAAAFAYETFYHEYLAMCWQVTYKDIVKHLVDGARKSTIHLELAGAEGDVIETEGALPYDQLLAALQEGIAEVEMLKAHTHEWVIPEDPQYASYCSICAAPGDI